MRWPRSNQAGRRTPLELEYDRLCRDIDDPWLNELAAEATFPFGEIALWRHPVRGLTEFVRTKAASKSYRTKKQRREALTHRIGFSPRTTVRPNPIVTGGLVIAITFNPAWVIAVDRLNGERQWELPLDYYGHGLLHVAEGTLYAHSARTLLAIDTLSGSIKWSWQPYEQRGEWIYSSPTETNGRVFLGDRAGCFHCLDARSGNSRWWHRPSRARNNDINSTPLVAEDRVIVATNSRLVLAYAVDSGRELWRIRIDAPSTSQVLAFGDFALVCTSKSIYVLATDSGKIVDRIRWRNFEIEQVLVAADSLLIIRRRTLGDDRPFWPVVEGLMYRHGCCSALPRYPKYSSTQLGYANDAALVYESTQYGLGIVDLADMTRRVAITSFWEGEHGAGHHSGLPSVADGTMYVLTQNCDICAIPHPLATTTEGLEPN